jgi:hypothetical protein
MSHTRTSGNSWSHRAALNRAVGAIMVTVLRRNLLRVLTL